MGMRVAVRLIAVVVLVLVLVLLVLVVRCGAARRWGRICSCVAMRAMAAGLPAAVTVAADGLRWAAAAAVARGAAVAAVVGVRM